MEQRDSEWERQCTPALCDSLIHWSEAGPDITVVMSRYYALAEAQLDLP